MIGGDKEVVAADVGVSVVWWAFRFYVFGEGIPLELCIVVEGSPCFDGSSV